ncbi:MULTISPECIES: hypothetical protein [Sediminimonas]|uniref:hypothetical protein n=1 Tax=Sediminimonas TaxID=659427 RepID=UPI00040FC45F|nr:MULTISPECIES: hypothetical protein [Sediminimonas]MDR9483797.1 hypothetical protein [Sediminimonas sp.]
MKVLISLMIAMAVLSGCGVDGAPLRPSLNAGVSVGTSGVTPGASVGLRKGPFSLGVAL